MRLILLIINLAIFYTISASAQYEQVWLFGAGAGLNFSGNTPVPFMADAFFIEAVATVCDKEGQLLFYSDGSSIWDRNYKKMPGGSQITRIPLPEIEINTISATQGTLIMPMPDSSGKYYVFSLTAYEMGNLRGRLYYSVVDMSLNNGMGDVVPGRKGILLDSNLAEKMTAVVGDKCNVWLVVRDRRNSDYKSWEITPSGITPVPVTSSVSRIATLWLTG